MLRFTHLLGKKILGQRMITHSDVHCITRTRSLFGFLLLVAPDFVQTEGKSQSGKMKTNHFRGK